jgi:hypothetical protein
MVRRNDPTPTDDAPDTSGPATSSRAPGSLSADAPDAPDGRTVAEPSLAAFPVIGLTRRRLAAVLGVVLAVWIVAVFARQVGDASAASARAGQMVADNAAQQSRIADLDRELDLIAQQRYILQQARGYGLGGQHEIAFSLDPDAPPLGANAPGSEALRVGAPAAVSPLERWLTLLFGPGGD